MEKYHYLLVYIRSNGWNQINGAGSVDVEANKPLTVISRIRAAETLVAQFLHSQGVNVSKVTIQNVLPLEDDPLHEPSMRFEFDN